GLLTVNGDLLLDERSKLNFQLDRLGNSDQVYVKGDLDLAGELNWQVIGDPSSGNPQLGFYRLFSYDGTLTNGNLNIVDPPTIPGAGSIEIATNVAGYVDAFIAPAQQGELQFWKGGDDVWSSTDANWRNSLNDQT